MELILAGAVAGAILGGGVVILVVMWKIGVYLWREVGRAIH